MFSFHNSFTNLKKHICDAICTDLLFASYIVLFVLCGTFLRCRSYSYTHLGFTCYISVPICPGWGRIGSREKCHRPGGRVNRLGRDASQPQQQTVLCSQSGACRLPAGHTASAHPRTMADGISRVLAGN